MSKKAVRRILAIVLAFTMMWGMCLSVSAAGGATSCNAAIQEGSNYQLAGTEYWIMDIEDVEDINSLPAGIYLDDDDESLFDEELAAYNALAANFGNCQNESKEDNFGAECGCGELYNAWVAAVNALEAAIKVSDGSNYVEPVVPPCTPSTPSDSTSTSSSSSSSSNEATVEEVVVKTPENDFNTFMETTTADVNKALEQINQAVAAGDTAKAASLRAEGVTVDTGVWYSYNLSVYEQIEKAGIPVTLKFIYGGLRWKVTIPAGAKVTELCDENGWCGFLNLAAHYGFELL